MKKFYLTVAIILVFSSVGFAIEMADYNQVTLTRTNDPAPYCPTTKISDNNKCMDCHVLKKEGDSVKFGIKEVDKYSKYKLPYGCSISIAKDGSMGIYWVNGGTNSARIKEIADYIFEHSEFTRFVMEMDSPGGSVMDAWRAIGMVEEMRAKGIQVETRCYGFAASAGSLLLIAGDKGKRLVNPHAEIMLHKLWTFAMFKLDDPDTAEDQAELMNHLQTNINEYIKDRTGLTHEQLDEKMFKKDWWVTGAEAVGLGIADGFIE